MCLSGMGRDVDVIRPCKDAGCALPYSMGKALDWDEMKSLLATLHVSMTTQCKTNQGAGVSEKLKI